MKENIGFIGLGNMGLPIATHLLEAGYPLTVYDLNKEKAKTLLGRGAKFAASPRGVIQNGSIIITMLPDDEALLAVCLGENGLHENLSEAKLHISLSTVSPKTNQTILKLHEERGSVLVCAPVFGRPESAIAKKLWVCLVGSVSGKNLATPVLECFSQKIYDFGEDMLAANLIKLAGNFMVLAAISAMGEAFAFVEKAGLDPQIFADMMSHTLFDCPVYHYHAKNIASKTFSPPGFELSLGKKDIRLLLESAAEMNFPMPQASLLYNNLLSSLAKNRQGLDWASITLDSFITVN